MTRSERKRKTMEQKALEAQRVRLSSLRNIRDPKEWGGLEADQLILTTFADIARAQDATLLKEDALVEFKTDRRRNVFDHLHSRDVLDEKQTKDAYTFIEMYAASLGKAGKRDTDDRMVFVDCRDNDPHEVAFRLRSAVARRNTFKANMPRKSFGLMEQFAINWIMDDRSKSWQEIVKGWYPKTARDAASAYVQTACDAVSDALEKGL